MRRLLLNAATAASLVLCVATVALWARSHAAPSEPSDLPPGGVAVLNRRGQVAVVHHRSGVAPPWARVVTTAHVGRRGADGLGVLVKAAVGDPAAPWDPPRRIADGLWSRPYLFATLADGARVRNGGGFGLNVTRLSLPRPSPAAPGGLTWTPSSPVLLSVTVPHWFLAAASAILPAARAVRRRTRPGHCSACGYDLRATPQRCPECGRVPGVTA
jgi:hypothetical protein